MYLFTDAWIITGGMNAGVVKEVGEAINNYRYKSHKHGLDVPCIGICTWEYTAGSEQLESPTRESPLTNDDDMDRTGDPSKAIRYRRSSNLQSVRLNLLTNNPLNIINRK
jgi:hypothetical protein